MPDATGGSGAPKDGADQRIASRRRSHADGEDQAGVRSRPPHANVGASSVAYPLRRAQNGRQRVSVYHDTGLKRKPLRERLDPELHRDRRVGCIGAPSHAATSVTNSPTYKRNRRVLSDFDNTVAGCIGARDR